jgi:hypothetical protein
MSSDDDKPLVPFVQPQKKELKKQKEARKQKPTTKPLAEKPKQPRFSKFADMHAKEKGHTDSEDEVSEDDRDQPDLSYITSDDVDNDVSDDMYAVYHRSLSSQASQHGFGTPIFKKRAKERNTSNGSIFDGIVAKHEGKRKKSAKVSPFLRQPSVTAVEPPNPPTIVSPSTHRSSMTSVLSLTAVSPNLSPFTNRTSLTAVLPMNAPPLLSPSAHLSPVTRHQILFERNLGPKEKVNRMKLKTRLSFPTKDCDLSLKLIAVPGETVRLLQSTAHILTSQLGNMSLDMEVPANVAATDQFLDQFAMAHQPTGNNDMCYMSPTTCITLFCRIMLKISTKVESDDSKFSTHVESEVSKSL